MSAVQRASKNVDRYVYRIMIRWSINLSQPVLVMCM